MALKIKDISYRRIRRIQREGGPECPILEAAAEKLESMSPVSSVCKQIQAHVYLMSVAVG